MNLSGLCLVTEPHGKRKRRFAILKLPLHPLLLIRLKAFIYFSAFFSTIKQRNGGFCTSYLNPVHVFFCFHIWFISIGPFIFCFHISFISMGSHSPYLFSAISHVQYLQSVLFNLSSVVLEIFLLILGTWGCEISSDQSCMINLTSKFHWKLKLLGMHCWFSCLLLLPGLEHQKSNK